MAWIITHSYIEDATWGVKTPVKVVGPRTASDADVARLVAGEGIRFKLYDDDDELYYEGRELNDISFAPLDDYGMPNAGAAHLKYLDPNKGWRTL